MWERTQGFLVKSGTVILGVSMALWLLMAVPAHQDTGIFDEVEPGDSLFGRISSLVAPAFAPAGFGSWQTTGSLMTGLLAKEVIISTMSQIYAVESHQSDAVETSFSQDLFAVSADFGRAAFLTIQEAVNILPRTVNLLPLVDIGELSLLPESTGPEGATRLESSLQRSFAESAGSSAAGPIAAVAFNVFVLLYIPCVSAVSAMRQEFGPRWMWAQIIYTLLIAWTAAVVIFQTGKIIFL
jgi:ferrous iron transport protein B